MLKSVRLKNFKLHEDTSIEAAPITVFIGPNNTGKSSIFQALLLLRQAATRNNERYLCQPHLRDEQSARKPYLYGPDVIIDIGAFDEIVRKGENEIQIDFSGTIRAKKPSGSCAEAQADVHLGVGDNTLAFHNGSVGCSHGEYTWTFAGGPPREASTLRLGRAVLGFQARDNFQLTSPAGIQLLDGLSAVPEAASQHSEWLGSAPYRLLQSLHPVYALRGFEEWGCPIADWPPTSLELLLLPDRGLALANMLASDRRLKAEVSRRLQELLHIEIDIEVVAGKRLKIWAKPSSKEAADTLFANEGTGANQLPFILVPIALTPPNETILLSEPEAHLHPKAQSDLVCVLLKGAKKQNLQLIIETHSEHVLHKLLHSVAKGDLRREELAIYYFDNEKGVSKVRRLEIDDKGGVEGGLPGFFDQSLDELSEYLDALKEPKS